MYDYIVKAYGHFDITAKILDEQDFKKFEKYGSKRYWLYPLLYEFLDVRNRHGVVELNKNTGNFIYYANNQTYMWLKAENWNEAIQKFTFETRGEHQNYLHVWVKPFEPYEVFDFYKNKKVSNHV